MFAGAPKMRTIAVAVAALPLLAVPAAAGGASRSHVHPSIKVKQSAEGNILKGRLKSETDACENRRKVKIVFNRIGSTQEKVTAGTVKTNGNGKWKYRPGNSGGGTTFADPGNYRAKVSRKNIGGVICLKGISDTLYVAV